jgi:hypothetical protein
MRVLGLATLVVGIIFMLLPAYAHYLPLLNVSADNGRLLGGLLIALGGIALAISTQHDS